MKIVRWAICFILAGAQVALAESRELKIAVEINPGANPWTSLEFNDNPDDFQFAVVADRAGSIRPGVFEDAMTKLNLLQPEFVMSVGDLIQGVIEDVHEIDSMWDELEGFVDGLEMPFFYVPGNHDLSNDIMARVWERRHGKSYYHFVYRNVLFLCLNTEDPPRTNISDRQVAAMAKALAENPDVRWTLAFMHKPMWTYDDPKGFEKIEALLKGRKYTVFAGHTHDYARYVRNDSRYLVLATTGGGSDLRGDLFGEFDHVAWITLTDEGPIVANLMLDGIRDENIRDATTAQTVAQILSSDVLTSASLLLNRREFERETTKLRLFNTSDFPMKLRATIHTVEPLSVKPASFEMEVAPNATQFVDVELGVPETVAVEDLPPVEVDWSAQYSLGEKGPLDRNGSHAAVVDAVFDCPGLDDPVEVDGKLGEWKQLPYKCSPPAQITRGREEWKGVRDASFRFAVGHDEESLFIGIEATDDAIDLNEGRKGWDRDGFEIRVDARPDPERSLGRGDLPKVGADRLADFLWLTLSPGESDDRQILFADGELPEGARAVAVATEKGLAAEVAIPFSYLDLKQGKAWTEFRLNVNQNDRDDERGNVTKLYWRPDWRTSSNYEGSGTFRRVD